MAEISRRGFVTKVAVTSAGFAIVPRHVLGRGFTAPSDTLNVAGRRRRRHGAQQPRQPRVREHRRDLRCRLGYADKGFAGLDNEIKNSAGASRPARRTSRRSTRRAGPSRR